MCITTLALVLVAPTSAHASAIHSGGLLLPEPHNAPSIGTPPPPADEVHEVAREVVVSYNASTGTVTFMVELWDAAHWGERVSASFTLGSTCREKSFSYPQAFRGLLEAGPYSGSHGVTGSANLSGYAGRVESTGTFDGRHFKITFASRVFRNRSWRCASYQTAAYLNNAKQFVGDENKDFDLGGWKPHHKRQP